MPEDNAAVTVAPEATAERVALWRALHLHVDAPPHVFEDDVGLRLLSPAYDWRARPDMDPNGAGLFRASIVARARFVEDLVTEAAVNGTRQYAILGAGLDTFAQRRPDVASEMTEFEVDTPGPQAWKKKRLIELGFGVPPQLRLVAVDFEARQSWWDRLLDEGFDASKPAIVASTGVSMYLTKDAIEAMLRHLATLAQGSITAMTFLLPPESIEPQERPGFEAAINGARASATPFLSFFGPQEIVALARGVGFNHADTVSGRMLDRRYFAGRNDNLHPGNGAPAAT